jgi:hypothetical protein
VYCEGKEGIRTADDAAVIGHRQITVPPLQVLRKIDSDLESAQIVAEAGDRIGRITV